MTVFPAGEDRLVLSTFDSSEKKGAGTPPSYYIADRPFPGAVELRMWGWPRPGKMRNIPKAIGWQGHCIVLNTIAGGHIWEWGVGGTAENEVLSVSATGSPTTIKMAAPHFMAVGDIFTVSRGSTLQSFFDQRYEVASMVDIDGTAHAITGWTTPAEPAPNVVSITADLGALYGLKQFDHCFFQVVTAPGGITNATAGVQLEGYVASVGATSTIRVYVNQLGTYTSGGTLKMLYDDRFRINVANNSVIGRGDSSLIGMTSVVTGSTTTFTVPFDFAGSFGLHAGNTFNFEIPTLPTGVTGLFTTKTYLATIVSTGVNSVFTIAVTTSGVHTAGTGALRIHLKGAGFVNGGRNMINNNDGYGRGVQNALFWQDVGETINVTYVRSGTVTRVATEVPHNFKSGTKLLVNVIDPTGQTVNLGGERLLAFNSAPMFTASAANPFSASAALECVVTINGVNLDRFVRVGIGNKFAVNINGFTGSVDINAYFLATLLTSTDTSSTFSIPVNTLGAAPVANNDETLEILSDYYAEVQTTGGAAIDSSTGSAYTTLTCASRPYRNPTQAGGEGGPTLIVNTLPGDEHTSFMLSATTSPTQYPNSLTLSVRTLPVNFEDQLTASRGWNNGGDIDHPTIWPWLKFGFDLTINYRGITGLHQWKGILDSGREIHNDIGSSVGYQSPFVALRAKLGNVYNAARLWAINSVASATQDIGSSHAGRVSTGLFRLTGITIPGGAITYDEHPQTNYFDQSVVTNVVGSTVTIFSNQSTDNLPTNPSNPLRHLQYQRACTGYSLGTDGRLTVTIESTNTVPIGAAFLVQFSGVTGADASVLNGKSFKAKQLTTTTFSIDVGHRQSLAVSGGNSLNIICAGGFVWTTGEAIGAEERAFGVYDFRHMATSVSRSWQTGRYSYNNSIGPDANDLVFLVTTIDRPAVQPGLNESTSYLVTTRRAVIYSAALDTSIDATSQMKTLFDLAYQNLIGMEDHE